MNIPTHLAAGMLVSAVFIAWKPRSFPEALVDRRPVLTGILCVGCSLASHLLLDAIPHYDVVYKILAFPTLPAIPRLSIVGLKVFLLSLPVLILVWPFLKTHPVLVSTTLFGAIYPDIEKGFYLNLPFPRWLVIFRHHSSAYSTDGGEEHKLAVLLIEGGFFLMSMLIVYWLTVRRQQDASGEKCLSPAVNP